MDSQHSYKNAKRNIWYGSAKISIQLSMATGQPPPKGGGEYSVGARALMWESTPACGAWSRLARERVAR